MTNKFILGTVQLGLEYGINNQSGKPSLENAFDILCKAFDNGIAMLDTAEAYGNSQEIIGKFQKENPDKNFKIITKLAANHSLSKGKLINHIFNNCKILGTNQLYGYMFHNYQIFKSDIKLLDEFLLARKEGLLKKVGISLYTNSEVEDIIENYSDFDFIQLPFNLFDNESKRKAVIEKAKRKGIEVHTRSAFLQGLFFRDSNTLPEKLQPLSSYMKMVENIKIQESLKTETLALQYVLQKEYIDYVLIGVENIQQLMSNIHIGKEKCYIPHAKIDVIDVYEEELLNPSNWN